MSFFKKQGTGGQGQIEKKQTETDFLTGWHP